MPITVLEIENDEVNNQNFKRLKILKWLLACVYSEGVNTSVK